MLLKERVKLKYQFFTRITKYFFNVSGKIIFLVLLQLKLVVAERLKNFFRKVMYEEICLFTYMEHSNYLIIW